MRSKVGIVLVLALPSLVQIAPAQSIPKEIWGKWTIRRELPTRTISCWGEADARKIIGTQIEYSDKIFRWNRVTTNDPTAEVRTVTAARFEKENSSPSVNGSQVSFQQLGVLAGQVTEISIHHEPADLTKATVEIPGDSVLVKDANTIIFSVCNLYFEATRARSSR
jgi:hypothetical protein